MPVYEPICDRAEVVRTADQLDAAAGRMVSDGASSSHLGGRRRRYSAVVGSITLRTRLTASAGKPPRCACSRIISSLGARYTQ